MEESRNQDVTAPRSLEISDAAIERALNRILEAEKPYFNPAGTLAQPTVGRESAPS